MTDAIESALQLIRDLHHSETEALQLEVNKQRCVSEEKDKRILELERNQQGMKDAITKAKVKILHLQEKNRRLQDLLLSSGVSIPQSVLQSPYRTPGTIAVEPHETGNGSALDTKYTSVVKHIPSNPTTAPLNMTVSMFSSPSPPTPIPCFLAGTSSGAPHRLTTTTAFNRSPASHTDHGGFSLTQNSKPRGSPISQAVYVTSPSILTPSKRSILATSGDTTELYPYRAAVGPANGGNGLALRDVVLGSESVAGDVVGPDRRYKMPTEEDREKVIREGERKRTDSDEMVKETDNSFDEATRVDVSNIDPDATRLDVAVAQPSLSHHRGTRSNLQLHKNDVRHRYRHKNVRSQVSALPAKGTSRTTTAAKETVRDISPALYTSSSGHVGISSTCSSNTSSCSSSESPSLLCSSSTKHSSDSLVYNSPHSHNQRGSDLIPDTDSQLSLDVFQTIPLSQEIINPKASVKTQTREGPILDHRVESSSRNAIPQSDSHQLNTITQQQSSRKPRKSKPRRLLKQMQLTPPEFNCETDLIVRLPLNALHRDGPTISPGTSKVAVVPETPAPDAKLVSVSHSHGIWMLYSKMAEEDIKASSASSDEHSPMEAREKGGAKPKSTEVNLQPRKRLRHAHTDYDENPLPLGLAPSSASSSMGITVDKQKRTTGSSKGTYEGKTGMLENGSTEAKRKGGFYDSGSDTDDGMRARSVEKSMDSDEVVDDEENSVEFPPSQIQALSNKNKGKSLAPATLNSQPEEERASGSREGERKRQKLGVDEYAQKLAAKAGLPSYKCVTVIRKKADREKLDAKACPECQAWYDGKDGIHRDQRSHLKHTCRHKHLYAPPDSDPRQWVIGFPDSEECDKLMNR